MRQGQVPDLAVCHLAAVQARRGLQLKVRKVCWMNPHMTPPTITPTMEASRAQWPTPLAKATKVWSPGRLPAWPGWMSMFVLLPAAAAVPAANRRTKTECMVAPRGGDDEVGGLRGRLSPRYNSFHSVSCFL
jgi:hypothetical protein